MKTYEIFVPIYNWNITIAFDINLSTDRDKFLELLATMEPSEINRLQSLEPLKEGKYDFGETYINPIARKQLIYFGKVSSFEYLLANKGHEFRHCIDAIVKTHDLDDEAAGYLTGWFEVALFKSGFYMDWLRQYKEVVINLMS